MVEFFDILGKVFSVVGLIVTIIIVPLIRSYINLTVEVNRLNMKIEFIEKMLYDIKKDLEV